MRNKRVLIHIHKIICHNKRVLFVSAKGFDLKQSKKNVKIVIDCEEDTKSQNDLVRVDIREAVLVPEGTPESVLVRGDPEGTPENDSREAVLVPEGTPENDLVSSFEKPFSFPKAP